jgi:hypothetical protein
MPPSGLLQELLSPEVPSCTGLLTARLMLPWVKGERQFILSDGTESGCINQRLGVNIGRMRKLWQEEMRGYFETSW